MPHKTIIAPGVVALSAVAIIMVSAILAGFVLGSGAPLATASGWSFGAIIWASAAMCAPVCVSARSTASGRAMPPHEGDPGQHRPAAT
jgi:hypothetical protein